LLGSFVPSLSSSLMHAFSTMTLEGMFTNMKWNQVGLQFPPALVVQFPFRVTRRSASWGFVDLWGVRFLVALRCYGQWASSSAGSFSVHSACRYDMLLKMATKNCVSSRGRRSASSSALHPVVARKTGRSLQGLECIFLFFRGCPYKKWAVIIKIYEWKTNLVSQKKKRSCLEPITMEFGRRLWKCRKAPHGTVPAIVATTQENGTARILLPALQPRSHGLAIEPYHAAADHGSKLWVLIFSSQACR
jgi:hypothetical protein